MVGEVTGGNQELSLLPTFGGRTALFINPAINRPRGIFPRFLSIVRHSSGIMEIEQVRTLRPVPEPSLRPRFLVGWVILRLC